VLELLAGTPTGIPTPELAARGFAAHTIARLARQALVSLRQDRVNRDPFTPYTFEAPAAEADRRLTLEQASALERLTSLADSREFRVALLHGVTGSGKTEIYLRLAAAVRAGGRTAVMLVPEIALTPAVASLFRQTFGERVAVQHSGLSDGERHDQWQRIRHGEIDVVVGTRSAVFAPIDRVGLMIVDEEHDTSYKQEESPRYNGRDVAIVRAQHAGALVVLGSATPSMESYYNAMSGKYERVLLERRVLDRPLAAVTIVDMREEYAAVGPDASFASSAGSSRWCCSTAAALRRRCSAASAPARSSVRTAACPSWCTAKGRRRARAATTAITRSAFPPSVRFAPDPTWSRQGSGPSASKPR
jgi:primosomal protein N' (replication factor Y)